MVLEKGRAPVRLDKRQDLLLSASNAPSECAQETTLTFAADPRRAGFM